MRIWPDTLPGPIGPGYRLSPYDPSVRSDMEAGPRRVRRITTARHDSVSVSWKFTDIEMAAFRAFHDDASWSLAGDSDSLDGWTFTNATPGAAPLAPDGAIGARFVPSAVSGQHRVGKTLPGLDFDLAPALLRATLKSGGVNWARLELIGRDLARRSAVINLVTGVLGTQTGLADVSVKSRGSDWWRLSIQTDTGSGVNVPIMRISALSGDSTADWTGDGTAAVNVCEMNARLPTGYDLFLRTDAYGDVQGAAGGSGWFLVPLAFGGGLQTVEARFEAPFTAEVLPGLGWMVTASLEIRNA